MHLAVNTLLRDDELPRALELIRFACSLPVDAVLVQDLGLLLRLRACAPELPLHASTQMSLHTPQGAAAAKELGFSRAVLSRELTKEKSAPSMARWRSSWNISCTARLCMSVSGQCYFSAMLGSRSGNRGMCAQPCRLPFAAPGGTGHDLSLKDLSLIGRLSEFREIGVCSAKIEGRMKRPEYVAAAVAACRLDADGKPVPPELLHDLQAVFSRSGFTTGFFDAPARGKTRPLFGVRSKEDAAAAASVLGSLHGLTREEYPRVPVRLTLRAAAGEPLVLRAEDGDGFCAEARGIVPEPARTRPADAEACAERLRKTGGTPFFAQSVTCSVDPGLSLPASVLNSLRRDVLDQAAAPARGPRGRSRLRRCRFAPRRTAAPARRRCAPASPPGTCRRRQRGARSAMSRGTPQPSVSASCGKRAFPWGLSCRAASSAWKSWPPRACARAAAAGVRDCWTGNLGAARLARECGCTVHGGFSLNAANTAALEQLRQFGLADTELSVELTLAQGEALGGDLPRGLVAYGRLPLMLTRACPAANGPKGCLHCARTGPAPVLTDRRGARFPVQCAGACSEVLNSVPLELSDRLGALAWADFLALRFTTESVPEQGEVLRRYLTGGTPPGPYTRGLTARGIL